MVTPGKGVPHVGRLGACQPQPKASHTLRCQPRMASQHCLPCVSNAHLQWAPRVHRQWTSL